jgi:hypothetical protein
MIFLERLAKKSEEKASDDVVRQSNIEDSLTVSRRLCVYLL